MTYRLGIDLGGTSAKIALVNNKNKIIKEGSVPTQGFPNPGHLCERMIEVALRLTQPNKPKSLGVGVAGDIDSKNGVVRISPNLGWRSVPLKKLLLKKIKCPVSVDNDANAAAWGIYKTQVKKSVNDVAVLTLGTGVGGGLIINGNLHKGATGSAGEIGHMNIDQNGPLCNCGLKGCLETYVGGPHMVRKVKSDLEKGVKSSLQSIFLEDSNQISPFLIAEAANKGDAYALSIWEGVGRALGLALGDLIYLLNPEEIYFTGGIAQAKDLYLQPLWKTLEQRPFKTPIRAVKIKVAKDAALMGVVGAALL
jgi:glucokinase